MMPRAPVKRPPGRKATESCGWTLPEVLGGMPEAIIKALNDLDSNPADVAALAFMRGLYRTKLTPVAQSLGVPPDLPLLVEVLAFSLAEKAALFDEPAGQAGRPHSDPKQRAAKAADVAYFVDEMKARNASLSDTACLSHPTFRAKFQVSETAGRRLLVEGRREKQLG